MIKKIIGIAVACLAALAFASGVQAQSTLKNAYVSTSNSVSATAGVTHTFSFFHPGATFGAATFQYCVSPSGTCTDTDFDISSAAEGVVTEGGGDDAANWATTDNNTDTITTTATTADTDANNTWVFSFTGIDNANIGTSTCTGSTGNTRTCYVRIKSYDSTPGGSQTGSSVVSTTVTNSVTVSATVNPSFSLIISGVNPSQTAAGNGTTLTSTITPTVTTIPFGNLTPGTEKFAAQSATVTTNAYNGYTITARMNANMTGNAYGDDIDPFTGGTTASFTVAEPWELPDGTTSGTDTGWLGVGTDDSITGQASNEFFSLGTTATTVASQSTSAQSELDIFVFGIEVNSYQRADAYSGTLRYNTLPTF